MELKLGILLSFVLSAVICGGAQSKAPEKPALPSDYSKEAYVVEHLATTIAVEDDGGDVREVAAEIKVLADAGVKELAVLSFIYTSANEVVDVDYVRVRKPDGIVVTTPDYNVQDVSAEVTRNTPMYSDVREKHVAVKGLGVGDVLEYRIRIRVLKPQIPGQFWYEHSFSKGQIIRDERVELSIPKGKHLTVKSPDFKPEIEEDGARRIYTWKYSHVERSDNEETPTPQRTAPPPSIQVSTFSSWQEVGRWYWGLQKNQVAVTPAIEAKAKELTKTLSTDDEKLRAIYRFVSVGIHYVGLDFGIGRFQPHAADDVLGNEYGDCKDKHTLLAALLKAAGYEAWPALIHSSRKLDAEVPSLAQFNHVITVVPRGDKLVWLDTTPEVAPYELLLPTLRDKQALVMPTGKDALLLTTPANPPFPQGQRFTVTAKLGADGVLKGHIEQNYRGDSEVVMRSVLRQTPQPNWKELIQRLSYSLGFGGEVSNVIASPVEDFAQPFEISYDYMRKDFANWKDRQITAPLPPFGIESAVDNNEKPPKEPVFLGAPGEIIYQSQLELPNGDTLFLPKDLNLDVPFAEYHSVNVVEKGVFKTTRRLVLKKSEVPVNDWESYRKLAKSVSDDRINYLRVIGADDGVVNVVRSVENSNRKPEPGVEVLPQQDTKRAPESVATGKAASASSDLLRPTANPQPDIEELRRTIQSDLTEEKFDELDRMAEQYRREKPRFPGGGWFLRAFYGYLDVNPQTDSQTIEHLAHLEHWMTQRPESITARIALADSLRSWAWMARGHGFADKVTEEGWRLYNERITKADAVLESPMKTSVRCPEWYFEMLKLGLDQGWEASRMKKILEQGIQLEPDYQYLYRQYAIFLLPKWFGKEGDAAAFAKSSADKVGGDAGDLLYYQIATALITRDNRDFAPLQMDWSRIQHGYKALSAKFGLNSTAKNQLAYFACRFKDWEVARQQFALVGDDWTRDVWGDRKLFDQERDWLKAHN